jgi:hypothetical protein
MGCPYWKEVVMVYCDASPVKKLVPADRVVQTGHCSCGDFDHCPIFLEAMARLRRASEQASASCCNCGGAGKKEQP